jgi:dTMP kinase
LLPAPDLTLFLDLAPEVASKRGGYGLERYEKEELQSRVRILFGRIGAEMGTSWVKIDAGRMLNDVQREIWAEVQKTLEHTQSSVSRLWENVLSEQ